MISRRFIDGKISTNGSHFVTGKEAVASIVSRRIMLFLGEYFLDRNDGTRMYQSILGKSSEPQKEAELKRRILTASGVESIILFNLSQDKNRKISCSVTIGTSDGQIEISETL